MKYDLEELQDKYGRMNSDELKVEIDKLRAERTKYYNKTNDCQRLIDDLNVLSNDATKYLHNYIEVIDDDIIK